MFSNSDLYESLFKKKINLNDFLSQHKFTVFFFFFEYRLQITIHQCQGLPAVDLGGKSDPYVEVFCKQG